MVLSDGLDDDWFIGRRSSHGKCRRGCTYRRANQGDGLPLSCGHWSFCCHLMLTKRNLVCSLAAWREQYSQGLPGGLSVPVDQGTLVKGASVLIASQPYCVIFIENRVHQY